MGEKRECEQASVTVEQKPGEAVWHFFVSRITSSWLNSFTPRLVGVGPKPPKMKTSWRAAPPAAAGSWAAAGCRAAACPVRCSRCTGPLQQAPLQLVPNANRLALSATLDWEDLARVFAPRGSIQSTWRKEETVRRCQM